MRVLLVAGFGPITDEEAALPFYRDRLGLPLEGEDGYFHTGALEGCKHFALWPLSAAAESCFGSAAWPEDVPAPRAWIEFDVEDVAAATEELREQGARLLVADRLEPWGQRVTRLLGPDGMLVGLTHTPWLRGEAP